GSWGRVAGALGVGAMALPFAGGAAGFGGGWGNCWYIIGPAAPPGRPPALAGGRDDWARVANAHARIMWGMGLRPGDVVTVAAIFSLYVGSWGALAGAERLRAKAFPFGAGAAGMSARLAQWMDMIRPAAFYGTPTYALHLAETARQIGLDPKSFGLRTLFFSGEPGASIPAVKRKLEETWGARVIDSGSMGEAMPWMNIAGSAETEGMLCWQDVVYTEVCDPASMTRVPYGSRGTPVYTHLERTSQPMIRLLSGDLTQWVMEDNPCGRTYPRLPLGIIGRIDDMFTIRGENVYPSEIDACLNEIAHYGGEHRIVITRESTMDELCVRVEPDAEIWEGGEDRRAAWTRDVATRLNHLLGLRAMVELAEPGSIERTDFKARRVIDDRAVLNEMRARLERTT
ncbi:MAG: phenylacetate--CoA ligase family protein, partial [Rhodobacteraceae bacterium]|nr:phenylacetate--CoA ligase family protein [Paracoccaceae bacterium]